jgi:hypothetical protein
MDSSTPETPQQVAGAVISRVVALTDVMARLQ